MRICDPQLDGLRRRCCHVLSRTLADRCEPNHWPDVRLAIPALVELVLVQDRPMQESASAIRAILETVWHVNEGGDAAYVPNGSVDAYVPVVIEQLEVLRVHGPDDGKAARPERARPRGGGNGRSR